MPKELKNALIIARDQDEAPAPWKNPFVNFLLSSIPKVSIDLMGSIMNLSESENPITYGE